MAYQWDVFLSYRRSNDWPRFVEKHFLPKFRHWLNAELGQRPQIFVDVHEIETGEAWPYKIADALAHSRTMVCLWSREYFNSEWCAGELTHMLARRKSLSLPSGFSPPLILAVAIHDAEDIDHSLADIQRFPLQDYSNPWIANDSPTGERLSMEIERLAKHVAHAVKKAPEYDDTWFNLSTEEFMHLFNFETSSVQKRLPSLG